MEKDLRVKIIDVFGAVSSLAVIFFFFTLWLFSYNSVEEPLKEAWSSSISFLSVLSTLAAAYLAVLLFSDWRDPESFRNKRELADRIWNDFDKLKIHLLAFNDYYTEAKEVFEQNECENFNIFKSHLRPYFYTSGDLIIQLERSILKLRALDSRFDKNLTVNNMSNILDEYLEIFEINQFNINNFIDFLDKELEQLARLNSEEKNFTNALKNFFVIN